MLLLKDWEEGISVNKKNQRNANRRAKARDFINQYLSKHPCVDCGSSRLLEFDHVRGSKKDTIARLVQKAVSLRTIQLEIAKCDVRCSGCHTARHRARGER